MSEEERAAKQSKLRVIRELIYDRGDNMNSTEIPKSRTEKALDNEKPDSYYHQIDRSVYQNDRGSY